MCVFFVLVHAGTCTVCVRYLRVSLKMVIIRDTHVVRLRSFCTVYRESCIEIIPYRTVVLWKCSTRRPVTQQRNNIAAWTARDTPDFGAPGRKEILKAIWRPPPCCMLPSVNFQEKKRKKSPYSVYLEHLKKNVETQDWRSRAFLYLYLYWDFWPTRNAVSRTLFFV